MGPVERPGGGAEAGEGLPASAATRPPPGKVDEGTSLPVRGGEGSGGSRRGGTDSGFERIEPDDLLDRGRLELEMLDGEPLDALGLVEVSPFDPQDVRGLLALDDLLVGAVDLLLEVLHLVLHGEQTDRRGDGGNRPEQEPAMDHARPPPAELLGDAQARRAGARIGGDLGGRRQHRLAREVAQRGGALLGARRRMTRRAGRAAGAGAHEFLDRAVFQRMERDDGQPAARRQHLLGGGEAALELAQFVVHGDAQRLEGAGGGIALVLALRPDGAAHDLGQLAGGLDALVLARLDDGARDAAAAAAPRRSAR